jgi:hypothetical protein
MTMLSGPPTVDNKTLTLTTLHARLPEQILGQKDRSDIIHGDRISTIKDLIFDVVIRIWE